MLPLGAVSAAARATAPAVPRVELPAAWAWRPLPLSAAEAGLNRRHGAQVMRKGVFTAPAVDAESIANVDPAAVTGSLLVVYGASWRAHHPPEVCLAAQGAHIDAVAEIETPFRHRRLRIDGGRRRAAYWFQSPLGTTSSLLERIFAELIGRERRWMLVTALVDGDDAAVETIASAIHLALTKAVP